MATDPPVCYVTTRGRTSRKPHRIEIWFVEIEQDVYLLSGHRERADWVRNLMVDPSVDVELPGKPPEPFTAQIGPFENDADVRRLMDSRYHGEPLELTEWARNSLVVCLTPADGTTSG